jgi:hypothetical protein
MVRLSVAMARWKLGSVPAGTTDLAYTTWRTIWQELALALPLVASADPQR